MRRNDIVVPLSVSTVNNGNNHNNDVGTTLPNAYVENPWAGAYTKTFMRESILDPTPIMDFQADSKPYTLVNKLAAEFIGDLFFVFIGSLSMLGTSPDNQLIRVAFAHGLCIFILVSALGHISGGHFNPAVTLGVVLSGKLSLYLLIPYWIAQLSGAFVGGLLVRAITSPAQYAAIGGGATVLPSTELWYQGLVAEAVLTSLLVLVVLTTAVDTSSFHLAPLAIGMTIATDIFGAASISGAVMNPARSLGPCAVAALFYEPQGELDANFKSELWKMHYVYWAGPFLGAAISAFVYKTLLGRGQNRIDL